MLSELGSSDILAGLRALGIAPGDDLMLHCSLSAIGWVRGGADGLIDAVLAAVAPDGTALMPTLPDVYQPFEARTSPSTVGRVSEAFRLRPEAVRSNHPSHAVAAIGPRAEELVAGHERTDPTGPDSPYDRLRRWGGLVVLLGVDHDRNTMLHVAEALAASPYLRHATLQVVDEDGAVRDFPVRDMAYGHREFIGLDRRLTAAGVQRLGRIGNAVTRVMRADALVDFTLALLRRDPGALLCRKPRCVFCNWARERIRQAQTGEPDTTDWQDVSRRWGCGDPRCEICTV